MKHPIFTMPSMAEIAQNALNAHFEDRLQATSTHHSTTKGPSYYCPETGCCCAIGASIPPEVATVLDSQEYPAVTDLYDFRIIALPGIATVEQCRYLQRLHDSIVTMRMQRRGVPVEHLARKEHELLTHLKKLAGGRP